jgi:hypothetical protein
MAHTDPRLRIRNTLTQALSGTVYDSSRRDGDTVFVLRVRRATGKTADLRFLGLKTCEVDMEPEIGSALTLRGVGSPDSSLLRLFVPRVLRGPSFSSRVRIDAGKARLEIVCEDVEWWEDDAPAG